jgi:hypothetical protein
MFFYVNVFTYYEFQLKALFDQLLNIYLQNIQFFHFLKHQM